MEETVLEELKEKNEELESLIDDIKGLLEDGEPKTAILESLDKAHSGLLVLIEGEEQ